jgi:hypothetical protein
MEDFVFEVDITAVVRVLATDESAARKVVLTTLRTPGAAQINLANETNAFVANATICEVDFVVDAVDRIERAPPRRRRLRQMKVLMRRGQGRTFSFCSMRTSAGCHLRL